MKLTQEEVIFIRRLLEQEIKLSNSNIESPSKLLKKERAMVPKILECLPADLASEAEYKFNAAAKSVIKKCSAARLTILVSKIIPEYNNRQNNGQPVSDYVLKHNSFVTLLKGIISKCEK